MGDWLTDGTGQHLRSDEKKEMSMGEPAVVLRSSWKVPQVPEGSSSSVRVGGLARMEA